MSLNSHKISYSQSYQAAKRDKRHRRIEFSVFSPEEEIEKGDRRGERDHKRWVDPQDLRMTPLNIIGNPMSPPS